MMSPHIMCTASFRCLCVHMLELDSCDKPQAARPLSAVNAASRAVNTGSTQPSLSEMPRVPLHSMLSDPTNASPVVLVDGALLPKDHPGRGHLQA